MAKRTDVYYWSQSLTYKTLAGGNFTRGYYIKVGAAGSARITDVDITNKVLAVNGVANSSNFIDSATITEYSDSGLTLATGVTAVEDGSFTSSWVGPEDNQVKVRIDDSFMQPKFVEITIADFDNAIQNIGIYSAYKRVKIVENVPNKPIFFGRVEFMNVQNQQGGTCLVLQCKDYLQELQESIVGHDFSGPVTLGALVKDIIDYHVFTKISYSGLAGGTFTIGEHSTVGNWIRVGTTPNFGYARLIYDDTTNDVLVITDVLNSEYFVNGAAIVEFSDESCATATGVTASQSGDLYHNIDTSSISAIGTISADTAANYLKSSSSPLEVISSLCLNAASDGIFSFCLEEGSAASLYPPVFRLYLRETRPSVTPSSDGLTIKFGGTNGDQEREMQVDFGFPIPDKEIYTEVMASSVDEDNEQLQSSKKAGQKALELEISKQRVYQSLDHATQTGLDTSVDNYMSMTGNIVQRAEVSFAYYPYFYKTGVYTVVRAGDLVYVHNSRISYASSGVNMVVTKIEYEEPTSTTKMSLKQTLYGIGCPEYIYPNTQVGTEFPESIDTRIPDMAMAPWDDILPQSIQGYQHDITFAATDYRTISITVGTITFYDGTTQSIDSIDSHGATTYTMSTTGSPYPTIYMWFDVDSSRSANDKETIVCGDLTAYKAALVAHPGMVGLLCMSRASTNTSDYAYVLPSYGKEPLINCDVIQMSSLKKFDYSATPGTDTPEYLYSLQTTQVSSGKILLSADSGISTAGAEMAPALIDSAWTGTNGWSEAGGKLVKVTNASSGTETQTGGTAPAAGKTYTVTITAASASGSITYSWGGTAGGSSIVTGTITDTVIATNTNKLVITGAGAAIAIITAVSIKEQKAAWYAQSGVAIDANYGVSVYGTDMAFATFADSANYESWLAHMKASETELARAHCQCYVGSDGKISAGAGNVTLSSGGIEVIGEYCAWSVIAGTPVGVIKAIDDVTDFFLIATKNLYPLHISAPGSTIYFDENVNAIGKTISASFTGNVTGNCSGSSGSCTGNAATATAATRVVVTAAGTNPAYIAMFDSATGTLDTRTDTGLYYNYSSNTLTATTFSGNLTGNCSGSSGSCTGNAATATTATNVTVENTTVSDDCYVGIYTSGAGNLGTKTNGSLYFRPSSGRLTATSFYGNLTGNVTGNCSGSSGSCTGNAATATTATNVSGGSVSCTTITATGNVIPSSPNTYQCGTSSDYWSWVYTANFKTSNFQANGNISCVTPGGSSCGTNSNYFGEVHCTSVVDHCNVMAFHKYDDIELLRAVKTREDGCLDEKTFPDGVRYRDKEGKLADTAFRLENWVSLIQGGLLQLAERVEKLEEN